MYVYIEKVLPTYMAPDHWKLCIHNKEPLLLLAVRVQRTHN